MGTKDQLYQDLILDHFKHPRHQDSVSDEDCRAEEYNPACGDVVRLAFSIDGQDIIKDLHYETRGCAICVASSSMMSTHLQGHTAAEARQAVDEMLAAFKTDTEQIPESDELTALLTVKKFPMRLKCASLPWMAMKRAL